MSVDGFAVAPLRGDEVEGAIALWDEAGLLRLWNDPRADLAMAMGRQTSDVLAGRFDKTLIATAMVGHDGHRGWVCYLAVAQAHRGKGFGAAMMTACEDWCVRAAYQNCSSWCATTMPRRKLSTTRSVTSAATWSSWRRC